jgi:hypothetical protein
LGDKASGYIQNSGSGDITIEGDGAETVDGLTNYIMYGGEVRKWYVEGSAIKTLIIQPFYRAFTATGAFTKPPGYSYFGALLWSGGTSGTKQSGATTRGGPGGGCFPFKMLASTFGATEAITIGAGGASQTTNDTAGNSGGNTTIGALAKVWGSAATHGGHVSITGVSQGAFVTVAGIVIAIGFEAALANAAVVVNTTWGGATGANNAAATAGSSLYGGAAGGGHDDTTARAGGTSTYGGNGGAASVTTNGADGAAPGGGGGACKNTDNSGAGARGEVRIWGIA